MYPSHQYPPQGPVYNYPAGPPPMTRTSYRGWLIGAGVVFVAVIGFVIVLAAALAPSAPSRDEWSYRLGYRAGTEGGVALGAVRIGVNASAACKEAEIADQEFRSRTIVYVDYQKGCMNGLNASEI